jgi:hypothetical protein
MAKLNVFILASVAVVAISLAAGAAELKQVGVIAVPGEKLTNFDISFIDQATGRYYFADRSNKAIDIFDTRTDKFVDQGRRVRRRHHEKRQAE